MIVNLIISTLLLLVAWYLKLPLIDVASNVGATSIIGTLVQISAIMIGFIITAYSILISVSDKPLIKNMNITGHYSYLLRRLLFAGLFFGLNLIAGLYMLFVQSASQYIFIFVFSTLLVALVFLIDAARLFLKLVTHIND